MSYIIRSVLTALLLSLPISTFAQISIGGNIYGGGNAGNTGGGTTVTMYAGDIHGSVFGGARHANVGGSAFVNIDGKHASGYMVINRVYGGNDISGTIGTSASVPTELTRCAVNGIDNTWNAFVRISSKTGSGTTTTYYTQSEANTYNAALDGAITTSTVLTAAQATAINDLHLTGETEYAAGGTPSQAAADAYNATLPGAKSTSDIKTASSNQKIYIGQLFGGSNGDYIQHVAGGKYYIYPSDGEALEADVEAGVFDDYITSSDTEFPKPDIGKTYLEVMGGSIVYAYGGGNNATITESNVICVNNPSEVVNHIYVNGEGTEDPTATETNAASLGVTDLLTEERFLQMGINTVFSHPSSGEYQIGCFFGGNNVADMDIRPKWDLQDGKIRSLYSGGNRGRMLSQSGLLLEIPVGSTLEVGDLYGGCRMADVRPMRKIAKGVYEDVTHVYNIDGYYFPAELAARTLIRGGRITNVYGGNDVRGKVHFGNAVGIYTTIYGNVYGGGNGAYPYTDNPDLANNTYYNDFYYNPTQVLEDAGYSVAEINAMSDQKKSVTALNLIRPNAEQVSVRVTGASEDHQTLIEGQIFCGGNCATLRTDPSHASLLNYPLVELKIGSHAIINEAFLGNNGAYMVKNEKNDEVNREYDVLQLYTKTGSDKYKNGAASRYTNLDLTDADIFAEYMEGCAMNIMPRLSFDNTENGDPDTYDDYKSQIGSLYCGGNVGSMTKPGLTTINFNSKLIIFDKIVGGCNKAYVAALPGVNAEYNGGVIGEKGDDRDNYVENGNIKNRLVLNFNTLKIQPKRWKKDGAGEYVLDAYGNRTLEFNTVDSRLYDPVTKTYQPMAPVTSGSASTATEDDVARRLNGGHIYGGCYENGSINGNVVINLNNSVIDRELLFDEVETDDISGEAQLYGHENDYHITTRHTGVILDEQGMDVLGVALNVFGGGKGAGTEIWGSTVINLNGGYTFQIFGGSEEGVIGKGETYTGSLKADYTWEGGYYYFNGKRYQKDSRYSCYVNLCGTKAGVSKKADHSEEMAECEFMYGGSFFGPVCGNTVINLGNGRIFNSFAGSCNGDILGTAETFIGRQVKAAYRIERPAGVIDHDVFEPAFPWIRDIVYGANDLGGRILGENNYKTHVRGQRPWDTDYTTGFNAMSMVHAHDGDDEDTDPDVLQASAYVEYLQGRADAIFAGCYGTYDYKDRKFSRYTDADGEPLTFDGSSAPKFYKPRLNNGVVNFRPTYSNINNVVKKVYGAGQGQAGETDRDKLQNRSYVLIDIPDGLGNYNELEVFGAGAWGGVGFNITKETFNADKDKGAAIVDLLRGTIDAAYGGSYEEGVTRRTQVNVPDGSTITVNNIFGGAYGTLILPPCDVYESYVKYDSEDARVTGAIFGGNNNERRTVFTKVDINKPVITGASYPVYATVYGAGKGQDTWAEYTEVNINNGAKVHEVYGGGQMGHVLNAESVQRYMSIYAASGLNRPSADIAKKSPYWSNTERWDNLEGGKIVDSSTLKSSETARWAADWAEAWKLGDYFTPSNYTDDYVNNTETNLSSSLVRTASELDTRTAELLGNRGKKYNTNVIINQGATVMNYAYGGGLGDTKVALSGDVYGTTYIALLGGAVTKDIYAAGTAGSVDDLFGAEFTASANVYVKGGTVRNVYGGGWRGSVGYHPSSTGAAKGDISDVAANANDVFGESNVVIGDIDGASYASGVPSVTRNVYGGGEGGAIFGTANVYMNNGYIGYRFKGSNPATANAADYYQELHDVEEGDSLLYKSGNIFGGGYVANSYVDNSNIKMYGGVVRGSLYGGGEVGPIGRGTMLADAPTPTGTAFNGPDNAAKIYKPGKTLVELFEGHVLRNVFGGGRGHDNWGGEGYMTKEEEQTMDRSSKGYVFGQTRVNIRGGEIGTDEGMAENFGNVFGGSDVGYVYSAYVVNKAKNGVGHKSGNRYDGGDEGYYYRYEYDEVAGKFDYVKDAEGSKIYTEGCKVTVGPYCKVKDAGGITLTGIVYPVGATIADIDLKYLKDNNLNTGDYDANGRVTNASGITIASRTYNQGEYVPTYALHTLKDKNSDEGTTETPGPKLWNKLDDHGVIIHNAVFAGGNVSSGTTEVFANATTVYGNATATIHDVYHRDLITVGTGHTGGLYGDGNLTFVDGFRDLNITNYGTDYYNISMEITYETYKTLPKREQAYYEIKYTCLQKCWDASGKEYHPAEGNIQASTITGDELLLRFENVYIPGSTTTPMLDATGKPNPAYWIENGVCSRYAGRIMNTIQRADFCGVFGSRMVMQGAKDRVPEVVDNANYTINRVREVSLNKKTSIIPSDLTTKTEGGKTVYVNPKAAEHGNYFGIYSNVNFLGALTSDVFFTKSTATELASDATHLETSGDVRTTNMTTDDLKADGKTFYEWKHNHMLDHKGNRGTCHNEMALASGVYLEITNETGTADKKEWGEITGVIVLDLINVQKGVGGGFVYAKNVHGVPTFEDKPLTTLTALNEHAISRKDFTYTTDDASQQEWETSGNFIHDTQTIIDDCYPQSNRYKGLDKVPAHYWYIKGSVYIYDQYISAYTGAPNAYSKAVNIPLTITAASNGTMKLMDIQPNYYAFYSSNKFGSTPVKLKDDDVLEINGKEYRLNTPITYWDYNILSAAEQRLFKPMTYVTIAECQTGGQTYPAGYVMLPEEYQTLRSAAQTKTIEGKSVKAVTSHGADVPFDFVFRQSNNMTHDRGYILTYEVNNPKQWNKWYTPKTGDADDKINTTAYGELSLSEQDDYYYSPTYKPTVNGLYGQQSYSEGAIIPQKVYDDYEGYDTNDDGTPDKGLKVEHPDAIPASGQAEFAPAYVVTKTIEIPATSTTPVTHLYPGATVVESDFAAAKWAEMTTNGIVKPAYVCTNTVELEDKSLLTMNTVMTADDKAQYKTDNTSLTTTIDEIVKPAYYCTTAGDYGGDYYVTTKNYRGLAAWSSLSEKDRKKFIFNYDALDVLIDSTYSRPEGYKYQYDGFGYTTETDAENNAAEYSLKQHVDYTATYKGTTESPGDMTYKDKNNVSHTVTVGTELTREQYEALPNERHYYTPFEVPDDGTYKVHVVRKAFIHGNSPYAAGQTVSGDDYTSLNSTDLANVITLEFTSADAGKTYYFCRESYTIGNKGEGQSVKNIKAYSYVNDDDVEVTLTADQTFGSAASVPIGVIITEANYTDLTNRQKGFTIHGVAPVETSTLYVSRESDIYDLSTEKIITVIYEYDYEESDEEGMHITPVSERHVVNIHITFESGVPTVEDISAPKIVLPGTLVNLRSPNVTPGAYEVTGGGWMLFEKEDDTDSHNNGIEYTPNTDPLYWYQNGYYVAYYAQTYLGKTFSNAVKVSVANYHDIADVMADRNKTHHMYIDDPNVDRDSKIYITSQDGLDRFKELFDLSLIDLGAVETTDSIITATGHDFEGHHLLNPQVKEGQNLEFFMHTDIDHSATSWTSIAAGVADGDPCFSGNLHGDGHTISGLSSSLFGKLCGNVYNLGVRGTFTGAGIAETGKGYVENCWVSSTAATKTTQPVFGNPSRTGDKLIQVVNSYYQEEDAAVGTAGSYSKQITDHNVSSHGTPIRKPLQAFYNGEVAYDLNGFYLYKRYANNTLTSGTSHSFYTVNPADNKLTTPQSGYYGTADGTYSSSGVSGSYAAGGYVEERFRDGDFIYSGGSIPDDSDERLTIDGNGDNHYYPIWPDDYLFFGQALNYGHMDGNNGRDLRTPQDWPSAVNRSNNRIMATLQGNRVYRAPAYFRSGNMGVAHFNRYAVFAQSKNDDPVTLAYKNMTAIDFTGGNGDLATSHQLGKFSAVPYNNISALPDGAFYPPLLDDDGLKGFYNVDLTNNLLAYTRMGEPDTPEAMTSAAVSAHLPDEAYVETDATYRTVGVWDRFSGNIRGHWVQLQDGYVAPNDHMLVDRQDFNAPIAYDMASGKRMWYQREPERYVDRTKGWEAVSLPFSAEIVTTQTKGEITHFYSNSEKSKNSDSKIGHEYWLREFTAISNVNDPGSPALASFTYPISLNTDKDKTVTNTFLWDYYYEAAAGHNLNDQNADKYQTSYYREPRPYEKYARLTAAKPYIIGFPGKTYFEFDLSGQFGAATTAQPNPDELRAQVITFASDLAAHINVSDSEMDGTPIEQEQGGNKYRFTFKPSYLNMSFDAGTDRYLLDATGESFEKVPAASVPPAAPVAATPLAAFRPYFTSEVVSSSVKGETRSIIFSYFDDTLAPEEEPAESEPAATGYLDIRAQGRRIIVSSYLEAETTVHIFAASGALLDTYKIAPNQTVETRVHNTGIYLVNRKKLSIK